MSIKRLLVFGACTALAVVASRYINLKEALSSLHRDYTNRDKKIQFLTIDDQDFVEKHQECQADDLKYHILMPFIHGAFTSNDRYLPLLRKIQAKCRAIGIRLDIAFGSYLDNMPNEAETDSILEEILSAAKNKGIQYDAKIQTGHSMGGLLATDKAMPSVYDALIQLGCNFWGTLGQRSLASYPKPVLTLMGELDGFLRRLKLARDMDTLDEALLLRGGSEDGTESEKKRNDMDILKPIIVLKEINHMQAADDTVAEFQSKTGRHDFASGVTHEEAIERMAEVISSFMLITVSRTRRDLEDKSAYIAASETQMKQCQETRDMLRPFRELSNMSYISNFVMEAQRSIANLVEDIDVSPTFHATDSDFLFSKPFQSLVVSNGNTSVTTNIHIVAQDPILLHPKLPKSSSQESPTYAIKAKSQESFLQHSDCAKKGKPVSLRELNTHTMARVLEEYVTEEQRLKYESFGRKLEFLEDLEISSAPEWVKTPIQLTHDGNTTFVRCPYSQTPLTYPPKFNGMHYIKPMSPAQIYEFIVYDAFRILPWE